MSARVWTVEELDQVHPLPEGWVWIKSVDASGRWIADNGDACVEVDAHGRLTTSDVDGEDRDVVLAVILASKGLDSTEALAKALATLADEMGKRSQVGGGFSDALHAATARGRSVQAAEDAEMIRSGRVKG